MERPFFYIGIVLVVLEAVYGEYCVVNIEENAPIGSIIVKDITKFCEGEGEPVAEDHDSPFFYLNGSRLVIKSSIRLENVSSTVGQGVCHGSKNANLKQQFFFHCNGGNVGQVKCDISIQAKDNFPPSFCDQNCLNTTRITLQLNESQATGIENIIYSGRICDRDACGEDCLSKATEVNGSLIGVKTDYKTGSFELWLKENLDYESSTVQYFELSITTENHTAVTIPIVVNVNDLDDQGPSFEKNMFVCNISEGMFAKPTDTSCKVSAYDQDIGVNATLHYELISSFPNDVEFGIVDSSGFISVNGSLDRETTGDYALEIMVYEENRRMDRYNFTIVFIHVIDTDDNLPKFADSQANIDIVENLNNGAVIYTPKVTDIDECNAAFNSFGHITAASAPTHVFAGFPTPVLTQHSSEVTDYFPTYIRDALSSVKYPCKGGDCMSDLGSVKQKIADFLLRFFPKEDNARYTFSMDANQMFEINKTTGEITVKDSTLLDRERHPTPIKLMVWVNSTKTVTRTDTMILNVSLVDVNDNTPLFKKTSYKTTISKTQLPLKDLLTVHADDPDAGINGKVTYSLEPDSTVFRVNNTTGAVTLKLSLNETAEELYQFYIKANDNPKDSNMTRTSWAQVTIAVTDENIHQPDLNVVLQVQNITENGDAGEVVAILNCTDRDWGDSLNVSINTGKDGPFNVSLLAGTLHKITVTKALDRESTSSYSLEVQCYDGLHKTTRKLTWMVIDQNDNTPKFNNTSLSRDVTENVQHNFSIHATDQDDGEAGIVSYSLVITDVWKGNITINSTTGLISIHPLDREKLMDSSIDFTVMATDQGTPPLTGSTNVNVTAKDVNDNPPRYKECDVTHKEYLEEGAVYDRFLTKALDPDEGQNAIINYRCVQPTCLGNAVTVFSNGSISFNLTDVDGDSDPNVYNITIEAYNTSPYTGSGVTNDTQLYEIHVLDVNDNVPMFYNRTHTFSFNETCTDNYLIGRVKATDGDRSPEYNTVRYFIDPAADVFKIDKDTGDIYLNRQVDYDTENQHEFTFTVKASDGDTLQADRLNVNSSTTVHVTVLPVNEHKPEFTHVITRCVLPENYKGLFNCSVKATDEDVNSTIVYSTVNGSEFTVNNTNGEVLCNAQIEYDKMMEHTIYLNLSASDGIYTTFSTIVVELQDINDERPHFGNSTYTFRLYENNERNQLVGTIHVFDDDSPKLTLSLNSSEFQITDTGELYSLKTFDRETKKFYFLKVTANDSVHYENATIEVEVLDMNDNAPQFNHSMFKTQLSINETFAVGNVVLKVQASDKDTDVRNNEISYLIEGGNMNDTFTLNNTTGELTLKSSINASVYQQFDLVVVAKDGGLPAMYNVTNLTIHIQDVNNNPPFFMNDHLEAIVLENSNSSILKVCAQDPDLHDTLEYSVVDSHGSLCNITFKGNDLYANRINSESARNQTIACVIIVSDGEYNVSASVLLHIVDENDNKPVFGNPNGYAKTINDTSPVGTSVISVNASDIDFSTKGKPILYRFDEKADLHDYFQIDYYTGEITVQRSLEHLFNSSLVLTVIARDAGSPPLEANVSVSLSVEEVNVNKPKFSNSTFRFAIDENQPFPMKSVLATDGDGDTLSYRIVAGNSEKLFSLNKSTGALTVSNSSFTFDYESMSKYMLIVTATDDAHFQKSSTATVVIIVNDVNEAPYFSCCFENSTLVASVRENSEDFILKVCAQDPDLDDTLNYSVVGSHGSPCNISFNGNDLYANRINSESARNQTIACDIIVSDGEHNVSASVLLHIVDENDNKPVFGNPNGYAKTINDTSPVGTSVVSVTASDIDFSTKGQPILYRFDEKAEFHDYFQVDYYTGEITVQRSLEHLSNRSLVLTVIARDAGSPPLEANVSVTLSVERVNGHKPDFFNSLIELCVNENQRSFRKSITANDSDGDTVSYKIVGGNTESIFSLNETSGVLCMSSESYNFDYESIAKYTLVIEGTDDALFSKSSNVTVVINIVDVNEPPDLHTTTPTVYRRINTTDGNVIAVVTLDDPDTTIPYNDSNLSICLTYTYNGSSYELSDRTFFIIDEDGIITVKEILTENGTFILTVLAENLNITRYLNVTVVVSNIEGITKTYNLTENEMVPLVLGILNGNFTYKIIQPVDGNFTIQHNGSSFDLITRTTFDYESMPYHSLDFSIEGINDATKMLEKHIQVHVIIVNINDNPPVFNSSQVYLTMNENLNVGESIGVVTATDADGSLTKLTYTATGADTFYIDADSGTIRLNKSWDFDKSANHNLTLNVSCNDTIFSSSTLVTISLLDVNDNGPMFDHTCYTFNVSENTTVGVLVKNMSVSANDKDTMDTGKLNYEMIPGKDSHYFTLDPHTGFFTLIASLDFETNQTLEIDITVLDTASHNDTATVMVKVMDSNDNPPTFGNMTYRFTIKEGSVYLNSNFTISATDLDSGQNGQFILRLQEPHNTAFNLSQQPGEHGGTLNIVSVLDRENPEVRHVNGTAIYTATVIATDLGSPSLSSSALVEVYVEDVNDCPPRFSHANYSVDIQEGVDISQQVTSFTTTDCDYNPAFTHANFSLSGKGYESFYISTRTDNVAIVTVALELNRNTQSRYDLTVTAADGKNQEHVNLTIIVLDTNDHTPSFNQTTYTFDVVENQPPSVRVGIVSAIDGDVGSNGNVTYNITSGNQNHTFIITTNYTVGVGEIQTTGRLDRETRSMYVMIITAEDGAQKGRRQGTCTVTVLVNDINDNTPLFNTRNGYAGSVTENAGNMTSVHVVPSIAATDVDYGTNGTDGIHYSFENGTQTDIFHINATTGEIVVIGDIDREKNPFFNLMVIARDSLGGIHSRNTTMNLTIEVNDVNDCPPKFVNNTYSFDVIENSEASTTVGRVSVTDADVSGTENVRFRIIHGDDDKFYIDTTNASGIIRVSGNLDRETKAIYKLTVTASDGRNEGNTTVTVHVNDTNDNAPVFMTQMMSEMIEENLQPPTLVCIVSANDDDQINTTNSQVQYVLDQAYSKDFNITSAGEISALVVLDRETQATYEIIVVAKDNGNPSMNSSMKVTLTVGDMNDNNPEFFDKNGIALTEKRVNIVEKSPVDSVVTFIVARDKDLGENGTISFSIEASNIDKYFKIEQIDNATAVVRVAKSININTLIHNNHVPVAHNASKSVESVTIELIIVAIDNGRNGTRKSANMTITVIVEAINDATPVFLKPDRPLNVIENTKPGTVIGHCEATVINATLTHLTYALLDNMTKDIFSIDPENCTIGIKSMLDREKVDVYNFPVMVTDGRTPERTAFASIAVIVTDENDNSPVFHRPIIELDLVENTNYSRPIDVTATDADLGNNSIISYSLIQTYDGTFAVQEDLGIMTFEKPLDFEKQTNYTLFVVASDHGEPPLNSTSEVRISVIDENDNKPQFYTTDRTVNVKENYVGEIFTCFANDSDSGLNGKVLYSLSSPTTDTFAVDPTNGVVSVTKALDYEAQTNHSIHITASDQGSPPLSTSINVTIEVDDVYDFRPTFGKDVYECNITRSAKVGDLLIDLNASDARVKFAIKGIDTDYFGIDKSSGVITVSQTLHAHQTRYILTATASDRGHPNTQATCTVIVTVLDPLLAFPHTEYHVNLTENVGSAFLVDLNTTEELNGHEVLYTINKTIPEAQGVFSINKTGMISCNKAVDREYSSMYTLYITAEPGHARRKRDLDTLVGTSTLVKLVVYIVDVNDNPPEFPATQKQLFGVPRDARASYLVTTLKAVDKDEPVIGEVQIRYKLLEGALNMFDIQPDNGDLVVRRAISSVKDTDFNLTVLAFDPTDTSKNDTLTIKVHVIENNDRLMLVTAIPVDEFRKRQDDIIKNMSAVLGIDIQAEKVEAHREELNGVVSVSLDSSDLYFHGMNHTTGMPVSNADIMTLINSHSDMLKSLFGRFNVTRVSVSKIHESSAIRVPEIALISVALLIFIGGAVGIVFSFSILNSLKQHQEQKVEDVIKSGLDDFELGTIRSRRSSKMPPSQAIAAVNPAFMETEFNTSSRLSDTDKQSVEQESQEIRLEFGEEPIDRNLPEAEVRGGMVQFPRQSVVDSGVGNTSLTSQDVLQSGSTGSEHSHSDQSNSNGLILDTGPVMTSSPRVVRFKVGSTVTSSGLTDQLAAVKQAEPLEDTNAETGEETDKESSGLMLADVMGETETDDGIESDECDPNKHDEGGEIIKDSKIVMPEQSIRDEGTVEDKANTENDLSDVPIDVEEVTAF